MHLLHPELFQAKLCPVHIVTHGSYTRGMSVVNEQETDPDKCNTLVLMHGDRDKFIEYFLEDIKYLKIIKQTRIIPGLLILKGVL